MPQHRDADTQWRPDHSKRRRKLADHGEPGETRGSKHRSQDSDQRPQAAATEVVPGLHRQHLAVARTLTSPSAVPAKKTIELPTLVTWCNHSNPARPNGFGTCWAKSNPTGMTIAAAIVITATTTSVATTGRHLGECNRPFGKNKATSGTEKK